MGPCGLGREPHHGLIIPGEWRQVVRLVLSTVTAGDVEGLTPGPRPVTVRQAREVLSLWSRQVAGIGGPWPPGRSPSSRGGLETAQHKDRPA